MILYLFTIPTLILFFFCIFSFRQFVRLGEYDTESEPVDCIMYEDDKDCNDAPFDSIVTSMHCSYLICIFISTLMNRVLPGVSIHPKRMNSSKEYDIAIIILEKKPPYTGERHI